MTQLPSLRHLVAFDLTARLRAANRAAEAVNLSQPAVTKAIASIERHFGAQLFRRASVGMLLTEAGETVHRRVERALQHLATAGRRAGMPDRPLARHVTASQLRALIAVDAADGFASAARLLGLAQPSVHRAARELERIVGQPLIERVGHGLTVTQLGRDIARLANLAFTELGAAADDLAAMRGAVTGRVAVGCLPLARTEILPSAVNAVARRFPGVTVSIVEGAYETLLADLRRGDLDFIVGALRDRPPAVDVGQEALFAEPLCVIARVGHPLTRRRRLKLADVLGWPWVAPRPRTPARERFEQLFVAAGRPPPEGLVETGSLVALRGVLMGSDRLTILSRAQIAVEARMGMLVALDLALPGTERPIGLTTRRDWAPTALQAALVEQVRVAADNRAHLAPDATGRVPQ